MNQKTIFAILGVVIIILIGTIAYFATTKAPTSAGWQTYKKEGYGFSYEFELKYPGDVFTTVQVTRQLPPDYKSNYNGEKLISSARVSNLGKQTCSYGESGLASVCKAEMEDGIEFIQVDASESSLTSSLDDSLKTIVIIAGERAIKWSIGAEGDEIDYYYIPLNADQTLVVVRLHRNDGFPQQTLFDQILATLVIKNMGAI